MIRRLFRRSIRIGAVVGAILFLVQIFLRTPRPKDRDTAPSTPPAPTPATPKPPATKASAAPKAKTKAATKATAKPKAESAPGQAPAPAAPAEAMSNGAGETTAAWADPVDGGCPPGFPVKVKLASGIFHVPGGLAYDRTTPDRCYRDAASAEADGFRQAKR